MHAHHHLVVGDLIGEIKTQREPEEPEARPNSAVFSPQLDERGKVKHNTMLSVVRLLPDRSNVVFDVVEEAAVAGRTHALNAAAESAEVVV